MHIDHLATANDLNEKRLKLLALKTALEGKATIEVNGKSLADLLTAARVTSAKSALLQLVVAEVIDTEMALSAIDVQVE